MKKHKKIKVESLAFSKTSDKFIPAKEFKHLLEDDDMVEAGYEEGYFSENNSYDGYFYVKVNRMVLETDEQYETRIKIANQQLEEIKERRYNTYLILKKEFENPPDIQIKEKIKVLQAKIDEWDELAKDNEDNKHNLSTSERQDWVDEISDLNDYFC